MCPAHIDHVQEQKMVIYLVYKFQHWYLWLNCHSSWTHRHYETASVTFLKSHKNWKFNRIFSITFRIQDIPMLITFRICRDWEFRAMTFQAQNLHFRMNIVSRKNGFWDVFISKFLFLKSTLCSQFFVNFHDLRQWCRKKSENNGLGVEEQNAPAQSCVRDTRRCWYQK
jgi:hypothetical protein